MIIAADLRFDLNDAYFINLCYPPCRPPDLPSSGGLLHHTPG